jgi:hypothetical protein
VSKAGEGRRRELESEPLTAVTRSRWLRAGDGRGISGAKEVGSTRSARTRTAAFCDLLTRGGFQRPLTPGFARNRDDDAPPGVFATKQDRARRYASEGLGPPRTEDSCHVV